MEFGDFFGPETLTKEYKGVSLHKTGLPFNVEKIEEYCRTNKFDFDDLVFLNLKKYIREYIPKYSSGYWNSNIFNGEFFIGIDNYGFIKGIPISNNKKINKTWLHNYVNKTIKKFVRTENNLILHENNLKNILIDIIPVKPPPVNHEINKYYLKYLDKKKNFLAEYKEFLKKYHDWQITYEIVNMKLIDIVNIPKNRKILIEFIKNSVNCNQYILKILEDDNYLLPYLPGEEIKDMKKDIKNPFYWVTHFKDELCVKYKNKIDTKIVF